MRECVQDNLVEVSLEDAIGFCIEGAVNGEPLNEGEVCGDSDCLSELAENAEECAHFLFLPEPEEVACEGELLDWMRNCITENVADGQSLEESAEFCVEGIHNGEPLEEAGLCEDSSSPECLQIAESAEECAAAVVEEESNTPNPVPDVEIDECEPELASWMVDCLAANLEDEAAVEFCVEGVENGEPLEEAGICDDSECLIRMAENASDCAAAAIERLED
jgi:hypothetical protein